MLMKLSEKKIFLTLLIKDIVCKEHVWRVRNVFANLCCLLKSIKRAIIVIRSYFVHGNVDQLVFSIIGKKIVYGHIYI